MRDKSGRPYVKGLNQNNFHDLEGADILHIPPGYIQVAMCDPDVLAKNDGTEVGRYGAGQYGRCIYGAVGPKGIYGADYYDAALFW